MIFYDVETLVNCFTCCAESDSGEEWTFEISERRNDYVEFCEWLLSCDEMVGFNNLNFDAQVVFGMYWLGLSTADKIYQWAQLVLEGNAPHQTVLVPQIDLLRIHHFDNNERRTSLKMLEFIMRMDTIDEMPFPHYEPIAPENIPRLIQYNRHDVKATRRFAEASADKIALRRELSGLYSPAFMNYSDSKLGKQIIIRELKKAGINCYDEEGNPRQTHRAGIPVSHILLPQIEFRSRAFNEVLAEYKRLVVHSTKGSFSKTVTARGVEFVFALGGIHASVSKEVFEASHEMMIIDADVTSYYPNMSIRHGFYPEHLGEKFMEVYEKVYEIRAEHKAAGRKTLSEAYKLGLNSVYGDSNSEFSPFYDPQMTMSITINGQLLMAMLCEWLMWVPEFKVIQANTDGCTFYIPRAMKPKYDEICARWMELSKLNLEFVEYKKMWVRDVNNYIAQGSKVKLKGAYEYNREWAKDHGSLIVPKAAEAYLVHGQDIDTFIRKHPDIFDFMDRVKVNKSDRVLWNDQVLGGVVRYIVTKDGHEMVKEMPALGPLGEWKLKKVHDDGLLHFLRNTPGVHKWLDIRGTPWDKRVHSGTRKVYEPRRTRINAGQKVTVCNRITDMDFKIDYDFYIKEAYKLVEVFDGKAGQ